MRYTDKVRPPLTGQTLRATAFALLAKREYSKQNLQQKLIELGASAEDAEVLVEELAENQYQSDERMVGMVVRSQIKQGRGLARVKQALKKHHLDESLAEESLQEVDWLQQAYQLKVRKFGTDISKDPKIKAKQIRFLQYRGFSFDIIMQAIQMSEDDYQDYLDENEID